MENKLISIIENLLKSKNSIFQFFDDIKKYNQDTDLFDSELRWIQEKAINTFNDSLKTNITYDKIIKKIERDGSVVGFIKKGVNDFGYCEISKKDVNKYQCFYITKNDVYLDFEASIEYFDFITSIL
jgi:hypothetical protein